MTVRKFVRVERIVVWDGSNFEEMKSLADGMAADLERSSGGGGPTVLELSSGGVLLNEIHIGDGLSRSEFWSAARISDELEELS